MRIQFTQFIEILGIARHDANHGQTAAAKTPRAGVGIADERVESSKLRVDGCGEAAEAEDNTGIASGTRPNCCE